LSSTTKEITMATKKQHGPEGPAYSVKIVCKRRGCKAERWIKPQDAFQVRFCTEHQREATAARRRERAMARRAKASA
jgi:hypothetical protein